MGMKDQQIFNTIIEFFEEDEWDFQWVDGMPILSMGFSGKNGKWICYAQAREAQNQFVFYSILPSNAPQDKRATMAEFITRANYGMIIGNFEMDYDDGEIRYKTSVDIEGSELTLAMIRQLVYANLIITDRYFPGIMRIMYSDSTPEDVLEDIELEVLDELDEDEYDDLEMELLDLLDEVDEYDIDEADSEVFDEDEDEDDDDEPSANGHTPQS